MWRQILTAKSGISNHAAAGICDDPCLSKFGALHGLCPQANRQFVGLLCVSKRGRDTEWDASHGTEEIHEFCFKEFAAVCLFWNFFVLLYSCNITYHPKEVYAYRVSLSFVQISQNVLQKLGNNVENNDWVLHFLTHGNII